MEFSKNDGELQWTLPIPPEKRATTRDYLFNLKRL